MRRALLVVLACCLATAGVVSASALAGGSSAPAPDRAQAVAKKRALREQRQDRIAARLGKTPQQLRQARAAARREVLDRYLKHPRRPLKGLRRAMTRAIAKQLGVSVADLRAARRAERRHG